MSVGEKALVLIIENDCSKMDVIPGNFPRYPIQTYAETTTANAQTRYGRIGTARNQRQYSGMSPFID
jgi:hypothetical protein